MDRLLATALLLGGLLCCASAGCPSRVERVEHMLKEVYGMEPSQAGQVEVEEPAIVTVKLDVPPSMQDEFLEGWRKHEDATTKEDGNVVFHLVKTLGDNAYYWVYGEWKNKQKFDEHMGADQTKQFLAYLADHDINWDMYQLKNITDNSAAKKGTIKSKGKGDDPRDNVAHIVVEYHVPPSMADAFLDAWKETANATWGEEENRIYGLREVTTANHHYLAYGTWGTLDAYWDHFLSDHVQKLVGFLAESDIVWYLEPVARVGEVPEAPIWLL